MMRLTHWLLLLAMLLTPLAMAPSPAAATPEHHHTMAQGHGGHGPPSAPGKSSVPGECAMGCASALPAMELPTVPLGESVEPAAAIARAVHDMSGLHPEAATPPPRRG